MRLAALSNTELDPWINWTTLGPPLLNTLAAYPDAQLIAPPPFRWERRTEWWTALQRFRHSDRVFWMQAGSRPEPPLWALSATKPNIRRSAFVVDAWRPAVAKIGYLAVTQRLDPCFVAFREGYEELKRRFPRGRFEWLPFGVDTEVFCPGGGEREIFVYWMGRRSVQLHEALLHYCEERGLTYRYRRPTDKFHDPQELGLLAGKSKYFVVTPPDIDDPVRTGGFSPLVMRYLEGLAAGARLLGVLPASGEFEDLVPRDALCEVKADGSDLADKLDADLLNTQGWHAADRACELVRAQHSWARRAEQIYDRLADF